MDKKIRLNKFLAALGIASRRKIDQYIADRQITINNKLAQMGQKIDPTADTIKLNHQLVYSPQKSQAKPQFEYYALNKPQGYLSTTSDQFEGKIILDLVKTRSRLFPIGRLDKHSEGLLLLTNDGELTQKLTHPSRHIPKIYEVLIMGDINPNQIHALKSGIKLDSYTTQPSKFKIIRQDRLEFFIKNQNRQVNQTSKNFKIPKNPDCTLFSLTLFEGKKRQIRDMCASLHLLILNLRRISIGPIKLNDLPIGKHRSLSQKEITLLQNLS